MLELLGCFFLGFVLAILYLTVWVIPSVAAVAVLALAVAADPHLSVHFTIVTLSEVNLEAVVAHILSFVAFVTQFAEEDLLVLLVCQLYGVEFGFLSVHR